MTTEQRRTVLANNVVSGQKISVGSAPTILSSNGLHVDRCIVNQAELASVSSQPGVHNIVFDFMWSSMYKWGVTDNVVVSMHKLSSKYENAQELGV